MNIGRLVEDTENRMRATLNNIYFSKTQEVRARFIVAGY